MSKISNGNVMVKSCQQFPNKIKNVPSSKISQVREGGGSQNLGTVPKLYLVINYEGFPKLDEIMPIGRESKRTA